MQFEYTFDGMAVVTAVILAVAVTLAFGFYGTWRALGQRTAPLLRNE